MLRQLNRLGHRFGRPQPTRHSPGCPRLTLGLFLLRAAPDAGRGLERGIYPAGRHPRSGASPFAAPSLRSLQWRQLPLDRGDVTILSPPGRGTGLRNLRAAEHQRLGRAARIQAERAFRYRVHAAKYARRLGS